MKIAEKYAPTTLDDIIYMNAATERLIRGYAAGALEGHVMLWGPNGSGKSSVASLLPYAIGGAGAMVETKDFEELLANKQLANYLMNSCAFAGMTSSQKHFVVFHEFDKAGHHTERLWKAMDENKSNIMVIVTTNAPMKVHKSFRSRVDTLEMPAISPEAFLPRAQYILAAEGLAVPDAIVLRHLNVMRPLSDLRKYCGVLDKLLYLSRAGHSIEFNP